MNKKIWTCFITCRPSGHGAWHQWNWNCVSVSACLSVVYLCSHGSQKRVPVTGDCELPDVRVLGIEPWSFGRASTFNNSIWLFYSSKFKGTLAQLLSHPTPFSRNPAYSFFLFVCLFSKTKTQVDPVPEQYFWCLWFFFYWLGQLTLKK